MNASNSFVDQVLYRVAVALIGAVVGSVFGALVFLPLGYADLLSIAPVHWLGAAAIAGSVTGALMPDIAMSALLALLLFIWGVFAVLMQSAELEPPQSSPRWLLVAFVFGVIYAVTLFAFV